MALAAVSVGFDLTGNSAIRSANPENPTLEPKMKLQRYAHLYHISTSGGSSGDGFRIAVAHFLFIFNSDYGSIWLVEI